MDVALADIVVLCCYFILIIFVGVWTGRRNRGTEDYFVGGRAMPGWVVGVSILGTCISSVTYVAYPGKAFAGDWQYLVQGLMLPVVLLGGGFLLVRFYRKRVKITVNEFLEQRFGPGVRVFSVVFLVISEIARVGMVMYLFSLVVHTITGFDLFRVIIFIGCVTIIYAVIGGIQGVIWTDLIQAVVLVAGGLITISVISSRLPGGFEGIMSEAWGSGKFELFDFSGGLVRDTFFVLALSGLANYFYFLGGNQNQIQRYHCTSTDTDALKATFLGSLASVPVWALFLLVGTAVFVYYQHFPDPDVAVYVLKGKADKAFPHFIATALPAGVSGLLLAGLFGAAMSSLDSSMNAASTMAVTDVYRRFINPDVPDRKAFNVARVLTFFWGCIGVALAISMIAVKVFLDFYFIIVSLVIGVITGVFFLAVVSKRANGRGLITGILAGMVVSEWGIIKILGGFEKPFDKYDFPFHDIMVGVVATAVVVVVGYLQSILIARHESKKSGP
ncbi:MAG: sodium/solute symporter [bacterium]